MGGSLTSTTGFLQKTNMYSPALPDFDHLVHTNVARTGSSARQSLVQALESKNLPRETSALHNMTSENKGLYLMCLKRRHITRESGRKCPGLFALQINRNKTVTSTLLHVLTQLICQNQHASGVKMLTVSLIKKTAKDI